MITESSQLLHDRLHYMSADALRALYPIERLVEVLEGAIDEQRETERRLDEQIDFEDSIEDLEAQIDTLRDELNAALADAQCAANERDAAENTLTELRRDHDALWDRYRALEEK